jgi:hypothetical protein
MKQRKATPQAVSPNKGWLGGKAQAPTESNHAPCITNFPHFHPRPRSARCLGGRTSMHSKPWQDMHVSEVLQRKNSCPFFSVPEPC